MCQKHVKDPHAKEPDHTFAATIDGAENATAKYIEVKVIIKSVFITLAKIGSNAFRRTM
jgi:hypothetical protein